MQAMELTGRCVTVSEPASPYFVVTRYKKFGDSPELRQLSRDVIRWECRPYPSIQPPPLAYVIKIRPDGAEAIPIFRQRRLFSFYFRRQFQLCRTFPILILILPKIYGCICPPPFLVCHSIGT